MTKERVFFFTKENKEIEEIKSMSFKKAVKSFQNKVKQPLVYIEWITKKGREKQAKVSKRLKGVRKTRDKDEADWKAWQNAKSKAAGMGGTKADVDRAKELEKLPHVKARIKKMRDKQSAQSKAGQSRN